MARLLQAAPSLKYKAAISVAYGAGLRVSEVANLKVSDIDSARMMLRVEQGKGQRDRDVMLSPQLLQLLREWWKASRPQVWLFPTQSPINPVTARQLNRAVTAAKERIGRPLVPSPDRITRLGLHLLYKAGGDQLTRDFLRGGALERRRGDEKEVLAQGCGAHRTSCVSVSLMDMDAPFASRLGPGQSRPLTDASPGSTRSPGAEAFRKTALSPEARVNAACRPWL